MEGELEENAAGLAAPQAERREDTPVAVDEEAMLLLLKHGSRVPCRIVDLSLSGCRMSTPERFLAGVLVRVEATFKVCGIAFRFNGVTESINGQNVVGIRFTDLTSRRRDELAEVLCEVAAENAAKAAKQLAGEPAAGEAPPQYQPQPQGPYQPPQPAGAPQYQTPPPQVFVRPYAPPPEAPASGLPVWVLTVLFALAALGVIAGVVWIAGYFHNRPETKPSAATESPAAKPGAATNPLQRYIEISGVRFAEDPKHKDKTVVQFVVTNHSDAEIEGLGGNVTIWGSTRKSEEDAQGTFTFAANLKPMESKELTAPLNTKMKIYELPDWQNVTTDVQITSPGGSAGSPAR